MRKEIGAIVSLVMGLGSLIFLNMSENLISQASAKSPEETQKKRGKGEVVDALRTSKAGPGTPDGVLMMQAQALLGRLPAAMPGSSMTPRP